MASDVDTKQNEATCSNKTKPKLKWPQKFLTTSDTVCVCVCVLIIYT